MPKSEPESFDPAASAPFPREMIDAAIGDSLTRTAEAWERQTAELMALFRARVDRAIQTVDATAEKRAAQLTKLCTRAEAVLSSAGDGPASLPRLVEQLAESIRPWREFLAQGASGPELEPVIHAIVERLRASIRPEWERLNAGVQQLAVRAGAIETEMLQIAERQSRTRAGPRPSKPGVKPRVRKRAA